MRGGVQAGEGAGLQDCAGAAVLPHPGDALRRHSGQSGDQHIVLNVS